MRVGVVVGLVCLAIVPRLLEAGPLAEEKGNSKAISEW